MGSAMIITPDGTNTVTGLPDGDGESLAFMREAIGCTAVVRVRLSPLADMWLDAESLCGQRVNPLATQLARQHGPDRPAYYGPVVITRHDGSHPSGLTAEQVIALMTQLDDIVATA
jgi:hypothetical protein